MCVYIIIGTHSTRLDSGCSRYVLMVGRLFIPLVFSVGWFHCSYMEVTGKQTWILLRPDG